MVIHRGVHPASVPPHPHDSATTDAPASTQACASASVASSVTSRSSRPSGSKNSPAWLKVPVLEVLVHSVNPRLLSLNGVGVVTAATLLSAAGDNPERLVSKAAFAALAGVAPIPASSGQRVRHRLSRGGNRHANNALHRIVLLRMRHREPRTTAYFARRRSQGLTDRDIMRCLKRHIANEVYAALMDPVAEGLPGRHVRTTRQQLGIPITVLAATLDVPYQRLRRLEIGTRTDPELEQRATALLAQLGADSTA